MDNNLNNLEESDTFIEDISDESLLTLDETLESDTESDLSEGSYKTKMEADDEEDEINSDEEFMEYAMAVLKKAHGEDYDESKAKKTAEGILKKVDGDYGNAVGMLTSSLGEDLNEDFWQMLSGLNALMNFGAPVALLAVAVAAFGVGATAKALLIGKEAFDALIAKAKKIAKPDDVAKVKANIEKLKDVQKDPEKSKKLKSKTGETVSKFKKMAASAKAAFSKKDNGGGNDLKKEKEDLEKKLDDLHSKIAASGDEPSDEQLDAIDKIEAKIDEIEKAMKKEAVELGIREEVELEEHYIDTSDITRLVESEEGLSEEFKEKATFIFEAAVKSKVSEIEASLQESYEARLLEETETIKLTLEEQVDSYLTYAVETWMEDNKVAIESSLRTQIAENFIGALKNVFVEHYVEVPESKVDLFDQLEKENINLKEEAAKASRIADRLADRVDTLVREKIIAEASIGLADTQADKLKKLTEDIEFVDEDTFAKKVETIKEFYLSGSSNVSDTTLTENTDNSYISTETIVEEDTSDVSPEMKQYLNALSRMNRAMTADLL